MAARQCRNIKIFSYLCPAAYVIPVVASVSLLSELRPAFLFLIHIFGFPD